MLSRYKVASPYFCSFYRQYHNVTPELSFWEKKLTLIPYGWLHLYGQNCAKNLFVFYTAVSIQTRHSLEFIGGNFCQFLFVLVFSLFKCVS